MNRTCCFLPPTLVPCLTLIAVASGLASSAAQAVPIYYGNIGGDRTSFDAATANAGITMSVDDFEDMPPGTVDHGQNLARSGYAISTATISGTAALRSTDSLNLIEGSRSMILYSRTDPLTFTMSMPVMAFGATFNDLDMQNGGEFTVSIDGEPAQALLNSSAGNDLLYFFGVVSDSPFSTIAFDRTVPDGYEFDLVSFGRVPEPTALGLMLICFGNAFLGRRRR